MLTTNVAAGIPEYDFPFISSASSFFDSLFSLDIFQFMSFCAFLYK